MSKVCFIDTETTGLNADLHGIWEVGLIERTPDGDVEHHWMLPVNLTYADPFALEIGGFHQRHPQGNEYGNEGPRCTTVARFAPDYARLTHGAHLVGAVVSFDEERLRSVVADNGAVAGGWHYHVIDVETLAIGYLNGKAEMDGGQWKSWHAPEELQPPWDSKELSRQLGLDPESYDVHTALGDARWARDMYDKVMSARW